MKMLEGLSFGRRYNEHMGCIKGCLEYLGIDVPYSWLTGDDARVRAQHERHRLCGLCPGLGYRLALWAVPESGIQERGLVHDPGMGDDASPELFRRKQREAWDFVRAHIDRGIPCYGWELSYVPIVLCDQGL